MTNSVQHSNGRGPGGASSFTPPTSHPTWCDVQRHQAVRDEYEDLDPVEARKHFNTAGAGLLLELRWGRHVIRDAGCSWQLSLEQAPRGDDQTGGDTGLPFIVLQTSDPGVTQGCVLNLTSGEARTLAAQLLAAANKVDLA
jgi:hypothetical protein